MYRAGFLAFLVIAMFIVIQPLGVFWHFVHDHPGEHSDAAHDGVVVHRGDADASDHEADHSHVWTMPAAAAVVPQVRQPHVIAAMRLIEDTPLRSASPLPPFPPPRS